MGGSMTEIEERLGVSHKIGLEVIGIMFDFHML